MPNRLGQESSPYLQQHAQNPVDWHAWGAEALETAKEEGKPILLSIGYSSCHWCHVMERESFEDPATAALMNELFVCIKVDREERPDIDQVYMKAVQAMTGGGGWPLTVWLTPDAVPFYGGTYYPPTPRHGIPSFSQVLKAAADAFQNRHDAVVEAGTRLVEALARSNTVSESGALDASVLDAAHRALAGRYDAAQGGFGRAPKFPQPVTLELLLRHHARTGDSSALEMTVHTLRRMAAGGLRDHLAGGFHRYSVDDRWLVPHFEKMLYDNALLARMYLEAYRVTGEDDLRVICEQTLDYMLSDMRSPEGGFYTARDADSEGEEGVFYIWTAEEVSEVLAPDDARLFMRCYDVSEQGNFEGRNILHMPHELAALADSEGLHQSALEETLASAREKLLAARSGREHPFRDEKILVSWNAMTLRALAEAGATLGRADFIEAAKRAADFIWTELRDRDGLLHTYKDGESKIHGFLDDYAAFGNALLSLHSATAEPEWLEPTRWLCDQIVERFWSEESGRLFDSPLGGDQLVLRPRDPMDNATPSGTSLAVELLVRAGHVFDDTSYRDIASRVLVGESEALHQFGPAFGRLLSAYDRSLAAPTEIVLIGDPAVAAMRALIREAHKQFLPNLTVVGGHPESSGLGSPLFEGRELVDGSPTAYVCRHYSCRLPVTTPEALAEELAALAGS